MLCAMNCLQIKPCVQLCRNHCGSNDRACVCPVLPLSPFSPLYCNICGRLPAMASGARGRHDAPDDGPQLTNYEPRVQRWRHICMQLLHRTWVRGDWHDLGEWLKKVKMRERSLRSQPSERDTDTGCWIIADAPSPYPKSAHRPPRAHRGAGK